MNFLARSERECERSFDFDGSGLFRNLIGNTLAMTSFDTSHVKNIVLLGLARTGMTEQYDVFDVRGVKASHGKCISL